MNEASGRKWCFIECSHKPTNITHRQTAVLRCLLLVKRGKHQCLPRPKWETQAKHQGITLAKHREITLAKMRNTVEPRNVKSFWQLLKNNFYQFARREYILHCRNKIEFGKYSIKAPPSSVAFHSLPFKILTLFCMDSIFFLRPIVVCGWC